MYRPSTDLQSLLDVIEWAIDGGTEQFPTDLGESFEPSPGEPFWDVPHLRPDYQPGITGIQVFRDKHIGNVSTKNAPGIMARWTCCSARSEACKNLSSWDLMSMPKVISMIRAPVTLRIESECGTYGSDDQTQKNQQSGVDQEIVRGFSETREKAASIFVQIIVKPRHRIHVHELVKEPAASFQLASIINQGQTLRVHIHA